MQKVLWRFTSVAAFIGIGMVVLLEYQRGLKEKERILKDGPTAAARTKLGTPTPSPSSNDAGPRGFGSDDFIDRQGEPGASVPVRPASRSTEITGTGSRGSVDDFRDPLDAPRAPNSRNSLTNDPLVLNDTPTHPTPRSNPSPNADDDGFGPPRTPTTSRTPALNPLDDPSPNLNPNDNRPSPNPLVRTGAENPTRLPSLEDPLDGPPVSPRTPAVPSPRPNLLDDDPLSNPTTEPARPLVPRSNPAPRTSDLPGFSDDPLDAPPPARSTRPSPGPNPNSTFDPEPRETPTRPAPAPALNEDNPFDLSRPSTPARPAPPSTSSPTMRDDDDLPSVRTPPRTNPTAPTTDPLDVRPMPTPRIEDDPAPSTAPRTPLMPRPALVGGSGSRSFDDDERMPAPVANRPEPRIGLGRAPVTEPEPEPETITRSSVPATDDPRPVTRPAETPMPVIADDAHPLPLRNGPTPTVGLPAKSIRDDDEMPRIKTSAPVTLSPRPSPFAPESIPEPSPATPLTGSPMRPMPVMSDDPPVTVRIPNEFSDPVPRPLDADRPVANTPIGHSRTLADDYLPRPVVKRSVEPTLRGTQPTEPIAHVTEPERTPIEPVEPVRPSLPVTEPETREFTMPETVRTPLAPAGVRNGRLADHDDDLPRGTPTKPTLSPHRSSPAMRTEEEIPTERRRSPEPVRPVEDFRVAEPVRPVEEPVTAPAPVGTGRVIDPGVRKTGRFDEEDFNSRLSPTLKGSRIELVTPSAPAPVTREPEPVRPTAPVAREYPVREPIVRDPLPEARPVPETFRRDPVPVREFVTREPEVRRTTPAPVVTPLRETTVRELTTSPGTPPATFTSSSRSFSQTNVRTQTLMPEREITAVVPSANATGPRPQVTIEKVAPPNAVVGQYMIYHIHVRNVGTVPAHQVLVEDVIPSGAEQRGTIPQGEIADNKLMWKLGTLKPNETQKISVRVIPLREGVVGSVATVTFSTDETASRTNVMGPRLKFDVTGPDHAVVGQSVSFIFRVSNYGKSDADNVIIRNILPLALKHPDGDDLEYGVGLLPAGKTREVQLAVTAAQQGQTVNRGVVTADGGVSLEAEARLDVRSPNLVITREGPKRLSLNRTGTYVNTVSNPTSTALRDITITETIPAGLEFVRSTPEGRFDTSRRAVSWSLDRLDARQTAQVELTLRSINRGSHVSVVRAADGVAASGETVGTTIVAGAASLSIEVPELSSPIEVGKPVSCKVRIVNRGTDSATNVRASVAIPNRLVFSTLNGARFTRAGDTIEIENLPRLEPATQVEFEVVLQAQSIGDTRLGIAVVSDQSAQPIRRDEAVVIVPAE